MKDKYNEMMDQYEKDRRDQTFTWICKDAVMNELDTLIDIVDDPVATGLIKLIASILNRLPAHDFCFMDEVNNENETTF